MRLIPQLSIVFLFLACLLVTSLAEEELELPLLEEEFNQIQEESSEPTSVIVPASSEDENATHDNIEEKTDKVEVWLPIIEVQFVCSHDFRPPTANTSDFFMENVYENLYNDLLPEDVRATKSTLKHLERFSVMSDITPNKWYYADCNMTSPQLLASLKVKGKGTMMANSKTPTAAWQEVNAQDVHKDMNEASIKEYLEQNVCRNMTDFRAYVESPKHHHQQSLYYTSHSPTGPPKMTFEHVEHSMLLLCGGEDLIYYEEGPPDAGFLFFGFFVGFLMVSMIATELQKYDQRPHPLGGRRSREYDGVVDSEVEMV